MWDSLLEYDRRKLLWCLWFVTWIGLLAGIFDRVFYEYVVIFSAIHAFVILYLLRFQVMLFPSQVRIAYLLWVAVGTYVPGMIILMYITTIGLATNIFIGYCPLARMLYLFPWNREEPFNFDLIVRVIFTAPVAGQFKPKQSTWYYY